MSKNRSDIVKFKQHFKPVSKSEQISQIAYFEKLSVDYNSKPFWKACKPYFSNKNSYIQENIMLLEKIKLLLKQNDVAAVFNKHFGSITDYLNLFSWPEDTSMSSGNDTINSISKNCFSPKYKGNKKN